jgi:hypothetical protein
MDGDQELVTDLQLERTYGQRRLFIGTAKVRLKEVLLHNGNKLSSIPLAYAIHIKVTYENLQVLRHKKSYKEER